MTTKEGRGRKVVAALGGATRIHEGLREYTGRVEQMEAQRPSLVKRFPDKWVAMSDGDLVVADSLKEALSCLDEKEIPRTGAVIEFMDTRKRNMVL